MHDMDAIHEIEWESLDYETHWEALADGDEAHDDGPFHDDWLDDATLDQAAWEAWEPGVELDFGPADEPDLSWGPWPIANGPVDDGFA